MAEKRIRRSFTREVKARAVRRLLEGGRGLSEVATEPGIGTGRLGQCRTGHLAAGSAEALAAGNRQRLHSAVGYLTPAEARAGMEGIAMRAAA